MDSAPPVILSFSLPKLGEVVFEGSNHRRYFVDLRSLEKVFCFPKTESDWKLASVDSYGLSLIWPSRFEVHVDQMIHLAVKVEDLPASA